MKQAAELTSLQLSIETSPGGKYEVTGGGLDQLNEDQIGIKLTVKEPKDFTRFWAEVDRLKAESTIEST